MQKTNNASVSGSARVPGAIFCGCDVPVAPLSRDENRFFVGHYDATTGLLTGGVRPYYATRLRGRFIQVMASGEPLSRDQIIERVWAENNDGSDRTLALQMLIHHLRNGLRDAGHPLKILLVRHRVYGFSAPVSVSSDPGGDVVVPAELRGDLLAALEASQNAAARDRVLAGMRG